MSDDRLKTLRQQIEDAEKAIHDIPKDEFDSYRGALRRLERILAYASVVIDTTDHDLLSDDSFNGLSNALAQLINNPAAAGPNAGPWGGTIVDTVARLPAARGHEVAQEVKNTAANFKRSASQHLNNLREDVETTRKEAETRRGDLQEELEELRRAIDDERMRLGQLGTEQTETFREAQERRAEEAETLTRKLEKDLEATTDQARQAIEAEAQQMERVKQEMIDLSGAVALTGTSERYGKEARAQFWTANFWAALTITLALLAAYAAYHAATLTKPENTEFIGKLAIGAILGGISRYAAIQSSRHRRREVEARGLQLDLSAFGPFIEPLERPQQEEERVVMTRKTFGKVRGQDLGEDDPGPTPLSQLMQRKKAGDEREQEDG